MSCLATCRRCCILYVCLAVFQQFKGVSIHVTWLHLGLWWVHQRMESVRLSEFVFRWPEAGSWLFFRCTKYFLTKTFRPDIIDWFYLMRMCKWELRATFYDHNIFSSCGVDTRMKAYVFMKHPVSMLETEIRHWESEDMGSSFDRLLSGKRRCTPG
jgi:hypothetical protein